MENRNRYAGYFSESSFWDKLKRVGRKAGVKVIYPALLLYYVFTDSMVDPKIRLWIAAGLGYFILPIDLIPDLAPLIGFTDDLSVLLMTLNRVRKNINDSHRQKARETLSRWFDPIDPKELLALEEGSGSRS